MKETLSFIRGFGFAVTLLAAFVLGAIVITESNKAAVNAGYIEISRKVYLLVPAEAKAVEQQKPCEQTCNVE